MIIGICGKKQAGKDSMAGFIKKQLSTKKVQQISFAKPLKDFVHKVLNIPKNNLWGSDAEKNYPLCTWGEIFEGPALVKYQKNSRALLSAREVLQVIGTDIMRYGKLHYANNNLYNEIMFFLKKNFGRNAHPYENIWIDLTMSDIKNLKDRKELEIATISDVRFHNEVSAIKKNGGIMIRLYRDTNCEDSIAHQSELEMDQMKDSDFDFVLTERHNKNLSQLRIFTTNVLMKCGLIETGGIIV